MPYVIGFGKMQAKGLYFMFELVLKTEEEKNIHTRQ